MMRIRSLGWRCFLKVGAIRVEQAQDGEEAVAKALTRRPDLVIADLVMTGMDGLTLAATVQEECPGLSVIILTGHATVDSAVAAMKQGIYDYLTKPVDTRRLRLLIEKAIEKTEIVREVTLLRRQLKQARGLGRLLGHEQVDAGDLPPHRDGGPHQCRRAHLR